MNIDFSKIPKELINNIERLKIKENFLINGYGLYPVFIDKRKDHPLQYEIRYCDLCMNKDGEWNYEPLFPINRNAEYLNLHRYESIEEALNVFNKYNN
ncbi:MAG: hypothetical protein K0R54_511 [Clostridiaceae bacterium]|jgi:hypothetical protein|nr:hypothetical protein [Clostridiaceae bacterium]